LLITPEREESIGIRPFNPWAGAMCNTSTTQKRTGTLWEGRYKSTLIDSESYLLTCYRYMELNPVRANRVTHPCDYSWSSYLCHAEGKIDKLIYRPRSVLCFGTKNREKDKRLTRHCLKRM
ncbi:MAG: transposase, partial [Methylococcales bacterium]